MTSIEKLHRIGFSLILLQEKSKRPVDDGWTKRPRSRLFDIVEGFDDGCNIGFRPGVTSKQPNGRYIHVIDMDIRDPELRDEAIAKIEELFGRKFLKSLPRVQSGSGGDSRHFFFTLSRPMRAKTVAHSKEKFKDEKTGKIRWKWEIEVFGEGKQIVLPPSIHPDSGKPYVWLKEPTEDIPQMEEGRLDAILDELSRPASDFDDEDLAPLGLTLDEADEILSKLDFERWCLERSGWRDVGMALHHEFKGSKAAYKLWSNFSKRAENFDPNEQRYQWSTFGRNTHVRPIRMATLIKEAHIEEVRDAMRPSEDDAEEIREAIRRESEIAEVRKKERKPRRKTSQGQASAVEPGKKGTQYIRQPKHLITVPGILGQVVDIYNRSAPRPQPQYAVHAALAYGSAILGRNWVTSGNNYSSLYFLILGRTASGKEHCLKVIDQLMQQCELDLVGPTKYTSDAGLMTALEVKPKHVSLCDEFSRYLRSARSGGDAHQSNAQSALMEVWGRLDGVYRNKGYSGRGLSKQEMEQMTSSHVKRPALTLVGAATPDDFYSAIGDEDVSNGFLNRFLICETEVPRCAMRENIEPIKASSALKKWSRENAFPLREEDEDIMDAINRNDPHEPGEAIMVPFSEKAWDQLRDIDEFALEKMDELDDKGLDGLYGRVREIIMRLSLIIARSCGCDEIKASHVQWAEEYVFYHTEKMEIRTKEQAGSSDTQKIVSTVHTLLQSAAEDDNLIGLTVREITKKSRPFRNLDTRQREEIIKLLASDYGVVLRSVKRGKGNKTAKVLTIRDDE